MTLAEATVVEFDEEPVGAPSKEGVVVVPLTSRATAAQSVALLKVPSTVTAVPPLTGIHVSQPWKAFAEPAEVLSTGGQLMVPSAVLKETI